MKALLQLSGMMGANTAYACIHCCQLKKHFIPSINRASFVSTTRTPSRYRQTSHLKCIMSLAMFALDGDNGVVWYKTGTILGQGNIMRAPGRSFWPISFLAWGPRRAWWKGIAGRKIGHSSGDRDRHFCLALSAWPGSANGATSMGVVAYGKNFLLVPGKRASIIKVPCLILQAHITSVPAPISIEAKSGS